MFKLLALAAALVAASPALAQDFPGSQPIRIVVPFNPGGTTDLLARVLAEHLQKRMNHTVVVENRAGAATAIGTDLVAKAAPDGHTLLLTAADLAVLAAVRERLPYKIEELTYLSRFWVNTALIVTGPNSGINTIQELVEKIKANPGKVKNGTNGVGALNHLGSLKFESAIGAKVVNVPYNGQGPSSTDALAGTIDMINGVSVPLADGLKVLAPSGSFRHSGYPDLPTLSELGYKNADWDAWWGLLAPPNLPKPIADRIIQEVSAVFQDPAVIEQLQKTARHAPEKNPLTGEAFRKKTLEDYATWKEIAERENLSMK
jgi:tripartite-type tricarboxylate transporter receptor subunit TctC